MAVAAANALFFSHGGVFISEEEREERRRRRSAALKTAFLSDVRGETRTRVKMDMRYCKMWVDSKAHVLGVCGCVDVATIGYTLEGAGGSVSPHRKGPKIASSKELLTF
jgi:hypothetical protein